MRCKPTVKFPDHIMKNLALDRSFYSLDDMSNIERAKVDSDYLGDVLIVNENLIWHSVHKYVGKPEKLTKHFCVDKDDIAQLGRMGFIKAIYAFDTNRGVKFSSFSVTAIVREIKCFLRDSAPIIRPTRTAHDLLNRIGGLEKSFGRTLSIERLSEILEKPQDRISKALQIGQTVKYLHERVHRENTAEGREITHLDLLMDERLTENATVENTAVDTSYVDSVVSSIRSKLSDQELRVLLLRISGFNQTQAAEQENISQMRVGRIMRKVATLLLNSKSSDSPLDLDFTQILENYKDFE